jgi:hypothetical protein
MNRGFDEVMIVNPYDPRFPTQPPPKLMTPEQLSAMGYYAEPPEFGYYAQPPADYSGYAQLPELGY